MKEMLMQIDKTWKIMHVRPENEILRLYAGKSKNFTVRYMSKLLSFYKN